MKMILFIVLALIATSNLYSKSIYIEDLMVNTDIEYVFRLTNGDILTGTVSDIIKEDNRLAVQLKTLIGSPIIYENEISEILLLNEYYKHRHRVFLLPTALPIGNDHFLGNFELGLFYGGIGITDNISITAGRSVLPVLYPDQQITIGNVKASFLAAQFDNIPADIYIGFGGNLTFLNDDNRLIHFYVNGTYIGDKSSVTAAIFYKTGNQNFMLFRMKNEFIDIVYPNGSIGIGLGLDTKFSRRNDLRFIGEVWNSDINKPISSAILLGLRLAGTKFSADFGLTFVMEPAAFPFFSFVWTPM